MSAPSQARTEDQAPSFTAFISYATKADKAAAFAIAGHLETLGHACWIAPRNVRPGKQYAGEIVRGITTSRCFILVLSSAANGSKFVRREVEQADRKDKPVYTIRIEEVEPSEELQLFLSEIHWIDAFEGKLAAHVEHLAAMLHDEERKFVRAAEVVDKALEPVTPPPAEPPVTSKKKITPDTKTPTVVPGATLGEALQARWWVVALRGVLALGVGLGYELLPVAAFNAPDFASLIGAYLIADATLAALLGLRRGGSSWGRIFLLEALIGLAVGAAIVWTDVLSLFTALVALWALGTGAARAIVAWRLSYRDGNLWLGIAAAASLALGVILLVVPTLSVGPEIAVAGWIGLSLLAIGPAFLMLGLQLDRLWLGAISAERAQALTAGGEALARYWWAFAARGLIALIAGLAFYGLLNGTALPESVPEGEFVAWAFGLGLFLVGYGAPALVPGFGASHTIKLWRVFIGEAVVLVAAGLFLMIYGGSIFGFVTLVYYIAMLSSGLLLLAAASGLNAAFGRVWLVLAAFATLMFPVCNAAMQFIQSSSPFTGRPEAFLGWLEALALVVAALLIGFAVKLRARTREEASTLAGGVQPESATRTRLSGPGAPSAFSLLLPGAGRREAQSAVLARNWRLVAARGALAIAIGLFWVLADKGYLTFSSNEGFAQLYIGALLAFLLLDGALAIASGWRGARPQEKFVPLILSGGVELLLGFWVALQRLGIVRVPGDTAPWPPAEFWTDFGIGMMLANAILLAATPGLTLRHGCLWLGAAALTFIAAGWSIMQTSGVPEYVWIGDVLTSAGGVFFLVLAFQLWSRESEQQISGNAP